MTVSYPNPCNHGHTEVCYKWTTLHKRSKNIDSRMQEFHIKWHFTRQWFELTIDIHSFNDVRTQPFTWIHIMHVCMHVLLICRSVIYF